VRSVRHFAVEVAAVASELRAAAPQPLPRRSSSDLAPAAGLRARPCRRRRCRRRRDGARDRVPRTALASDRESFDLPRVTNFANKRRSARSS
jgi:hypothetical protein